MTKLDRLARSVADAHDIAKELTARQVKLGVDLQRNRIARQGRFGEARRGAPEGVGV